MLSIISTIIKKLCFLFIGLIALLSSCNKGFEIDRIISQQEAEPLNEYRAFRSPSKPEKIKKMFPEWHTTETVVLAFTSEQVFESDEISTYFIELIIHLAQVIDIVILVDQDDLYGQQLLFEWISSIELELQFYENYNRSEIRILPVKLNTIWVRDYGPIVGLNKKNEICILDNIYKDVRNEFSSEEEAILDNLEEKVLDRLNRTRDEILPIYLSIHLDDENQSAVKHVKTPIILQGGDFQIDSKRNVFVSYETLIMNGGDRDKFEYLLKQYYGAKEITYLHPLPGKTIKHIDMFFKLVKDDIILLGEYALGRENFEEHYSISSYIHYLESEANAILDKNAVILQEKFPNRTIVRMPMPSIEISANFVDSFEDLKSEMNDEVEIENDSLQIVKLLTEVFIDLAKEIPESYSFYYRTYLNSLIVRNGDGGIVLVPSYSNDIQNQLKVHDMYEFLFPDLNIEFVNSDEIIKQYGAIHCTTLTIPKID